MSFLERFKPAPKVRPLLNIGCLFDIPTGTYLKGKHGENILNGGLAYITGYGGRGNTYKSTMAHYMVLQALNRYNHSLALIYDTELSLTLNRLKSLSKKLGPIANEDFDDTTSRLRLTDKTMESGNKFFDNFRDAIKERIKNPKSDMGLTPFIDKEGKNLEAFYPIIAEIDSLSAFATDSVETMYDKNEVGASGLNTEALKEMAAKSQMLSQLPGLTGSGGVYIILTAHLGDEHQLDPYAPKKQKLTFLKGNVKFKRVPENFTFYTNNCYVTIHASVMLNQANKTPEFPRSKEDDLQGDTDLMLITMQNVRGKTGPTGLPSEIVVSQREGIHVGLTEFMYIKSFNRYGLGGHDRSYYLELTPDISMQRTTVRHIIDTNEKVRRALEITSEMCQIKNLWYDFDRELLCTPKELYEDIKALGYDWDLLLDTRGYWVFEEEKENHKPFLSTKDLLEMRKGIYHPYWYPVKKEKLKG